MTIDDTRESIIAKAKIEHDKGCDCNPRYLLSCPNMAAAILSTSGSAVIGSRRARTDPSRRMR